MERKNKKYERPATHPANTADLDKTEKGPARLFAPGKPHEVEAGPSRLQPALRRQQTGTPRGVGFTGSESRGLVETVEAGPARIVRHRQ
jgi:hypothetical protein